MVGLLTQVRKLECEHHTAECWKAGRLQTLEEHECAMAYRYAYHKRSSKE